MPTQNPNQNQNQVETPEVDQITNVADQTKNIGAPSYDPTKISIDQSDTVEGRVARMTSDPNASPLLQNAQTGAKQAAQSRGMLNSAMAAGMGQKAVIETATPIAMQDATMKLNEQLANQQADNQAKSQYTSGQQALQQTTLAAQVQSFLNRDNFAYEKALQEMRGDQAKEISLIETQSQQMIQASQSAAAFYAANAQAMAEIMSNAEIPMEQKQQLIDQQISLLRGGLAVIGGVGNLDLVGLLDFTGSGGAGGAGGQGSQGGQGSFTPQQLQQSLTSMLSTIYQSNGGQADEGMIQNALNFASAYNMPASTLYQSLSQYFPGVSQDEFATEVRARGFDIAANGAISQVGPYPTTSNNTQTANQQENQGRGRQEAYATQQPNNQVTVSDLISMASEYGYNASQGEAQGVLEYARANNLDPREVVMQEMRAMGLA